MRDITSPAILGDTRYKTGRQVVLIVVAATAAHCPERFSRPVSKGQGLGIYRQVVHGQFCTSAWLMDGADRF